MTMHMDELHFDRTDTYEHGLIRYREYIDRIEQKITVVREYYIDSIQKRATASVVAVALAFIYYLFFTPSKVEVTLNPALDPGYILPYIFMGAVGLAAFSLFPVFRYKHQKDETEDGKKIDVTLKEITFQKAFQFFGAFQLDPTGGIPKEYLEGSSILPYYDTFLSEDFVKGTYQNSLIQLCEAQLLDTRNKAAPITMFKGMLVVLTMPTGLDFKGRTVVIQDENKDISAVKEKLVGLERIDLPTTEYEEVFEALTTHAPEARMLLSEQFMDTLVALFRGLRDTSMQVVHTDDKIIAVINSLKALGKQFAQNPKEALQGIVGEVKRLANKGTEAAPESFAPAHDSFSINNNVQCSFYANHVLLTIPYDNDLFEPNSVFEHAFEEEDVTLTYGMMLAIFKLIDSIQEAHNPAAKEVNPWA